MGALGNGSDPKLTGRVAAMDMKRVFSIFIDRDGIEFKGLFHIGASQNGDLFAATSSVRTGKTVGSTAEPTEKFCRHLIPLDRCE